MDWETRFKFTADGLSRVIKQHGPISKLRAFASPSQPWKNYTYCRNGCVNLGAKNLDHRLHQPDFADQTSQPMMPSCYIAMMQLELQKHILVIGVILSAKFLSQAAEYAKQFTYGADI